MRPIAILVSDLHLSIKQPACRADDSWMEVQREYLQELNDLAVYADRTLPIICAGDIFDKWNPPPELIHFALDYLPDGMICVPGQHDLPNHNAEEIHRSGYGVLAKAGKIEDISDCEFETNEFIAHGFGWGAEITPLKEKHPTKKHIAVIHKYIFKDEKSCYPGASKESSFRNLEMVLRTYDSVVIGDNHQHWII